MRELLDPERGGIGGSAKSGEAEERLETLAQRRAELSKVCSVLVVTVLVLFLLFSCSRTRSVVCSWSWSCWRGCRR